MLVPSWQVTMPHVLYAVSPELILMPAAFSLSQAAHHVVTRIIILLLLVQ